MEENALKLINHFYEENNEELQKKKAEYFDKIAELFYQNNFGSANKSEVELLMFSILMDEMIEHYKDKNEVLDYKACSDYKMSALLGIPQQKVRNLKIKKQARYPQKFDWKKSFIAVKDSIVYDSDKKRIIIPVTDPNLYLTIRNFIEEHDGYIEIQRGSNVLQMRPEHFFNLLYLGIEEEEKEMVKRNFIKTIKEKNEENNIEDIYTDKELMDKALSVGDNVMEFFETVVEGVSNPLLTILKTIRYIGKVAKNR